MKDDQLTINVDSVHKKVELRFSPNVLHLSEDEESVTVRMDDMSALALGKAMIDSYLALHLPEEPAQEDPDAVPE